MEFSIYFSEKRKESHSLVVFEAINSIVALRIHREKSYKFFKKVTKSFIVRSIFKYYERNLVDRGIHIISEDSFKNNGEIVVVWKEQYYKVLTHTCTDDEMIEYLQTMKPQSFRNQIIRWLQKHQESY